MAMVMLDIWRNLFWKCLSNLRIIAHQFKKWEFPKGYFTFARGADMTFSPAKGTLLSIKERNAPSIGCHSEAANACGSEWPLFSKLGSLSVSAPCNILHISGSQFLSPVPSNPVLGIYAKLPLYLRRFTILIIVCQNQLQSK